MKVRTNLTIEPMILQSAKDKGLNISDVLADALKARISPKEEIPEEKVGVICNECKKFTTKGYYCRQSDKGWCVECHAKLDIVKSCFAFHEKNNVNHNKYHEHKRFGKWEEEIKWGKTLKDIECGNAEHEIE